MPRDLSPFLQMYLAGRDRAHSGLQLDKSLAAGDRDRALRERELLQAKAAQEWAQTFQQDELGLRRQQLEQTNQYNQDRNSLDLARILGSGEARVADGGSTSTYISGVDSSTGSDNVINNSPDIPGGLSVGGMRLTPVTPEERLRSATRTQFDLDAIAETELRKRAELAYPDDGLMQEMYVAGRGNPNAVMDKGPDAVYAAASTYMQSPRFQGKSAADVIKRLAQIQKDMLTWRESGNPWRGMTAQSSVRDDADDRAAFDLLGKAEVLARERKGADGTPDYDKLPPDAQARIRTGIIARMEGYSDTVKGRALNRMNADNTAPPRASNIWDYLKERGIGQPGATSGTSGATTPPPNTGPTRPDGPKVVPPTPPEQDRNHPEKNPKAKLDQGNVKDYAAMTRQGLGKFYGKTRKVFGLDEMAQGFRQAYSFENWGNRRDKNDLIARR